MVPRYLTHSEALAVFFSDAKGVVPVGEVHGDEEGAQVRQVAQVPWCFARHKEFGTLAVELVKVDD
jgi:hypothetical protein